MAAIYAPASTISKGSRLLAATTPSHLLNVQEGVRGFVNGLIFPLNIKWQLAFCHELGFSL